MRKATLITWVIVLAGLIVLYAAGFPGLFARELYNVASYSPISGDGAFSVLPYDLLGLLCWWLVLVAVQYKRGFTKLARVVLFLAALIAVTFVTIDNIEVLFVR